ncbi:hypothetical protein EFA69_00725 [Rufibacter immobilis]|uniref:Uncharacterized protein n=1 Tax=Rufibacter immobilis TaxID=1348778 RepID=A0A3M9N596_9BACT|nr:hypothetical protein EFA69_00725 [Rufibacter immobilis]
MNYLLLIGNTTAPRSGGKETRSCSSGSIKTHLLLFWFGGVFGKRAAKRSVYGSFYQSLFSLLTSL